MSDEGIDRGNGREIDGEGDEACFVWEERAVANFVLIETSDDAFAVFGDAAIEDALRTLEPVTHHLVHKGVVAEL